MGCEYLDMDVKPLKGNIWEEIDASMRGIRNKKYGAIAYLGIDAISFLETFKAGDLLLCNASVGTLQSGATNPQALEGLLDRGVKLINVPTLHAKVLVAKSTVIIGSMNASWNSAKYLKEAAVEINDEEIASYYKDWIKKLGKVEESFPIDKNFLDSYGKFYKAPRHAPHKPVKNTKKAEIEEETIVFEEYDIYEEPPVTVQRSIDANPAQKKPLKGWEFEETWGSASYKRGTYLCMIVEVTSKGESTYEVSPPAVAIDSWKAGGNSKKTVTRWLRPIGREIDLEELDSKLRRLGVVRLQKEKLTKNARYQQKVKAIGLKRVLGDFFQVNYDLADDQLR